VPIVSKEHFVTAIATQCDGHFLSSKAAYQISRKGGGIGEGLVVPVRQVRDQVLRIIRGQGEFGVFGAEMIRHGLGMGRFVITRQIEADGEGLHGSVRCLLHQGDDR